VKSGFVNVLVDLSVGTEARALGRLSGSLRLPLVPQIGDILTFSFPAGTGEGEFSGVVRVTERLIPANGEETISISLSDIRVNTTDEADSVSKFFASYYKLFWEPYGTDYDL
jgi:hypothetical protein